jgi:maltose alpha-D-glucosyltransferase/alpha-amylase
MSTLIHETRTRRIPTPPAPPPAYTLPLAESWLEVFSGRALGTLTAALQQWLPSRRWFRGKARSVASVTIRERITVPVGEDNAFLLLFQVSYSDGEPELYVVPLACALGEKAESVSRDWPQLILAHISLHRSGENGVLYDAIVSQEFCRALLALTSQHQTVSGQSGDLEAEPTGVLRRVRREQGLDIDAQVSKAEQSNSSIIYGGSIILKFFRRLDAGINPELEIERFLSARHFPHSPALAGALEYHNHDGHTSTMAVLTTFIPGCHDAWEDTLSALQGFYQKVQSLPAKQRQAPSISDASQAIRGGAPLPQKPADLIGSYMADAATLGRRTAALHLTLASDAADPAFRPEPWTPAAQRALFESLDGLALQNLQLLQERLPKLPPASRTPAERVLEEESHIRQRLQRIAQKPVGAVRIRTHGDYHLGQVLHHGPDFLIIDFEGEPAVALEERRAKQSALRDVAGMIYSFFYAANSALRNPPGTRASETRIAWARYWSVWVGTSFLRAYLETAGSAPFIPADQTALKVMLDVELLRKAIYELGYELNNRPDWLNISCQVLLDLLNPENPI